MIKYLSIIAIPFLLTTCEKDRFFEDEDDPGLSRFTYRGYDVSSAYINGEPWVRPFYSGRVINRNEMATAYLEPDPGPSDTLNISFFGQFNDGQTQPLPGWKGYDQLNFAIPVRKNFTGSDFLAMAGKTFPEQGSQLRMWLGSPLGSVTGFGKIYFVNIDTSGGYNGRKTFLFNGLFEGNIGDTILVTKGRFDYHLIPENNNLP